MYLASVWKNSPPPGHARAGKWVVATTDQYLMVVKTTYTDDKGRAANGFLNPMGQRGSMPRLLRLTPEVCQN